MTIQEAIEIIKIAMAEVEWEYPMEYVVAFEEAIEALEEQIPKKLIETEEFVEGSCQNCKRNIGWIKDEYFDFDNCPFCGQAISWEGADYQFKRWAKESDTE